MAKIFRSARTVSGQLGSGRANISRRARAQVDMAFPHASHGPILPMEEPGFFARLFRRH
ncbi:hypothetical protein [Alteraurantiacibacter aestuarii]|uniref:Uncharacterized protein n=1 Tax=Alteraurantiacibacter aestuarii TaxID=650004 RepID=A0A844ZFN7_9SPHN|nr:hypothetical protein [Alteraurantiacibacter aestuarii]MXO87341.1 hypothetical protein [Alteraurantiacibacter aestuarii]